MVHSINGYNYGYYNKVNNGLNNNSRRVTNIKLREDGAETTSSVAFKGNSMQAVKNTGVKNTKKLLGVLAGMLGIGVATKAVQNEQVNKLSEYREKYPELSKVLDAYSVFSDGRDDYFKADHYSIPAKEAIFETYERNPEEAYKLAEILKFDESKNLTPEIVDFINNNYEELTKYPANTLEDSYKKMEIAKQNPLIEAIATYGNQPKEYFKSDTVNVDDLAKYSQYCTTEESANALLDVIKRDFNGNVFSHKNSVETNIAYANFYKKHPEMSEELKDAIFKTELTEEVETLTEKYLAGSETDNFVDYVKEYGFEGVDELLEYHSIAPRELKLAKSYCESNEDIKELTQKIIMIEKLFDGLNDANVPEDIVKLRDLLDKSASFYRYSGLAESVENMDINKMALYQQMIKDGRCRSLKQMTKLLPVYETFPNAPITPETIRNFDPLAKAMKLY